MRYKEKIIISGDVIEHFVYGKSLECDYKVTDKNKPMGRQNKASADEKVVNRHKVQQRAKSNLRRLINANARQWFDEKGRPYEPKFITLTFAENITDVEQANPLFTKFVKRLSWHIGHKLEYNVVVEFQKRGAVHYHAIFYNLPYIKTDKLADIWGHGFVKVNRIDNCDNVGAYVCKYMGKALNDDDDKLSGKKCYFSSRGLKKPVEVKEKSQVKRIVSALPDSSIKYTSKFTNDYTGEIIYTQYNLMYTQCNFADLKQMKAGFWVGYGYS